MRIPLLEDVPARIGLVKPSALGDVVQTLPILTALRHKFPTSHITWIVNRGFSGLLEGHPHLDAVLPFDRKGGVLQFARFLQQLRSQRFDWVIDLQGLLRSGVMSFATRARRRIGLKSAREGAGWFYTDVVDDTQVSHAVDRYWSVIDALGGGERHFVLDPKPDALTWAQDQLRDLPRPWLGVGVGARWLTKRWPTRHFAELVSRMFTTFGGSAIFIGAPDEADLARDAISRIIGPSLDLTGKTTLPHLTGVLSQVDLLLSNDTGPLHLAAALGRPVLAPYTCTQVRRNGPYGPLSRAVETTVDCRGSYVRTCPHMKCMDELTPDRLWPLLFEQLASWKQQRQSA